MSPDPEKEKGIDRSRHFWEMKAKKYPLPFDPENLSKTAKVIALVKSQGVEIAGADLLDIGCGTGIYTLPLAREALKVTGVDLSKTMLDRFKEEAQKQNLTNWTVHVASWDSLDVSSRGFLKGFDVVWTAMSMAVRHEEEVRKMMLCSKKWCVFIGWGNKRRDTLMEEVFKQHGLSFGPPPGASVIVGLLKKMGRSPSLDFINTSWEWTGTVDEALEDLAGHIAFTGQTVNREVIKDILAQYVKGGQVRHRTEAEEGVVVWPVI